MGKNDDRFPDLPELPSDEELGIAGLDEETLLREDQEAEAEAEARARGAREGARPSAPTPAAPAPPPPPGGRPSPGGPAAGGWPLALAALLVLLLGGWFGSGNRSVPRPVSANAPATEFSSARAMTRLVELARAPRPVGSPEHARARAWLLEELRVLGLEPRTETHEVLLRGGVGRVGTGVGPEGVRAVTVRNVVATIPGVDPTGTVVLTAHYDGVHLSHAAGDAGTGVVAILEAVRALLAGPPLANDLLLLFTDAEELGLLGAREFVARSPLMDQVRVVLSFEMRGGAGPVEMFETGSENGWVVGQMAAFDPHPRSSSMAVEVYRRLPNDTDFTPFRQAGVQGLNFAAIGRSEIYHQASDRPEAVDEGTLQHMGARALALARGFGSVDLAEVRAPDRVYLTLPMVGITGYPASWALPLAAGVLLLWLLAAWMAVRRSGGWGGLGAGVLLALLALLAGGGAGWGLRAMLPRFHAEVGSLTLMVYREGIYVGALLAGVLAVLLVLLLGMRRWFAPAALAVGAGLPVVLGAVALAVAAPPASMELTLAGGALALGGLILALGSRASEGVAPWAGALALLPGVVVLLVLVMVVEGVVLAMGLWVAPWLGVLLALTGIALLPAIHALGTPNGWWAPLAAVAVAGLLLAGGLLTPGPDAERPHPSTLLYALDRGPLEVQVTPEVSPGPEAGTPPPGATGDQAEATGASTSAAAQGGLPSEASPSAAPTALWLTREDAGFGWVEETLGPFAEPDAQSAFLLSGAWRSSPAPSVALPAPRIERLASGVRSTPAVPWVRLALYSEVGAEGVHLVLPEEGTFQVVSINGEPVPAGPPGSAGARRPVTRVSYQGIPEGGALLLEVERLAPPGEDGLPGGLSILVVEEHLRASELLASAGLSGSPFTRPPHLQPNPRNRSDRALLRTVLQVEGIGWEDGREAPSDPGPSAGVDPVDDGGSPARGVVPPSDAASPPGSGPT